MKKSLYLVGLLVLTQACGTGKYEQGARVGVTWAEQNQLNTAKVRVEYNPDGSIKAIDIDANNAVEIALTDDSMTAMKSAVSKSQLDKITGNRKGMLDNNAGVNAEGIKTSQELSKVVGQLEGLAAQLNPSTAALKALKGPKEITDVEEKLISPTIQPE